MQITIACVGRGGRAKHDAAQSLIQTYTERLPWPVTIREVEDRRPGPPEQRRQREGALLQAVVPKGAVVVALDEHGRQLTSRDFAGQIAQWRDAGEAGIAFLIGGADGLDPALLAQARLKLAFGAMTWPHLLARVLLLEQLYRAWSLLNNHPYHRD